MTKVIEKIKKHCGYSIVYECDFCGTRNEMKESHFNRVVNHFCDMVCMGKYRSIHNIGTGNPNYNNRGCKSKFFKGNIKDRKNNKLNERMIYVGDWYKHKSENGRVKLHRYLVEKNYKMFDPDYFEEIDGWHYLKDGIHVHHKDGDHNNNDICNLIPVSKSTHMKLHNQMKKRNIEICLNDQSLCPIKQSEGSAGYDIICPSDTIVRYGRQVIKTGIKLSFRNDVAGQVRPRSGMSLNGLEVYDIKDAQYKNPIRIDADVLTGLIDSDYRGELGVIIKSYEKGEYLIKAGTRIAQLVFIQIVRPTFVVVDSLDNTSRGSGGFGSTGTHR